ncbi:ribulokinase [Poriferisphaera sp. WC338]|uniref:ribulokinase n=1 Tax=Poriferisphaera sp. WC338 TaxID=3425129 RepID=UPI003D814F58
MSKLSLGLDFGTESVRAILVDLDGNILGSSSVNYKHGQITDALPTSGEKLPHDFALQHPQDWLDDSITAVQNVLKETGANPDDIIGVGVDFTSCTMLPAKADGTPLCLIPELESNFFAWPKLWKHHGAVSQTDRFNEIAIQRNEDWLKRYGNVIGLEWFFPKILETLEEAPDIYKQTDVWLEAGDWYTWQLVGAGNETPAANTPRSTCIAGYKALWNGQSGYPSPEYLEAVNPNLKNVVSEKMPGKLTAPGQSVGNLCNKIASAFGIPAGIPVSAAIIDAHSGVPGVGASEPGDLVMVMGTSSCHMLNSDAEHFVPGVAGVVDGGILPGFFGYETGQAAVGDAFAWLRNLLGHTDFKQLDKQASEIAPGSNGVCVLDWFNGCRTPLMDGRLKGSIHGLTLNNSAADVYRATLEASAFGFRWIVDVLRESDVPVNKLIATGGLPHHNPLLVQIYADVMGQPIEINPETQAPALGAAILGAFAAGPETSGFTTISDAITHMTSKQPSSTVIQPNLDHHQQYNDLYKNYRTLADQQSANTS